MKGGKAAVNETGWSGGDAETDADAEEDEVTAAAAGGPVCGCFTPPVSSAAEVEAGASGVDAGTGADAAAVD